MSRQALIEKTAGILSLVGIVTAPLDWVPLIAAGGLVLEVPNMMSLLFALLLPLALLLSRRMWRINLVFGLVILWSLLYFVSMLLHATPLGIPTARQQVMQGLFGWTLALCIAHGTIRLSRIGLYGLISMTVILFFSAAAVGVNLFGEVGNYLTTGNRDRFVYQFLRPLFNAFVTGSGEVDYLASQMNTLASGIVLFAVLVFLPDGPEPRGIFAPEKLFAFAGLGFAFIIFSTSASIVILVFLMIFLLQAMTRTSMLTRASLPLLFVAVLIVLSGPLMEFVEGNLMEDSDSRGSRIGQYEEAIRRISEHVLSGVGYFEYGGHPVHNWPLFSWSTGGYLPFLVVLLVYAGLVLSGLATLRVMRDSGIVLLPLMTLFLVRTSVGGAGGIPVGSAIVAVSIVMGLLERHHRLGRRTAAQGSDPLPGQVYWDRDRPVLS